MNLLSELVDLVQKFSPKLGALMGSPLSGFIITLLGKLFNADPTNQQEIIDKLKADPEAAGKIKAIELVVNDAHNAREREVAYTNATKQRDWMLPLLALVVALGFFLTVWVVILGDFEMEEKYFMYGLVIGIGVQFAQVYNYYFGQFNSELLSSLSAPLVKIYNAIFKRT